MKANKRQFALIGIALCSLALVLGLAGMFSISHAAPTPTLAVNPAAAAIGVGETIAVEIVISDVTDLYGVSVALAFDPALLEVIDSDGNGGNGVQIAPGSCPSPDFIVINQADNAAGTIQFDVASLAPSVGCTGNGVIASVTFKGIGTGQSAIHFDSWLLADSNGIEIPATSSDGALEVQTTTRIYFEPEIAELPLLSSMDVQIVVTDVENLYGVQLAIKFDPAILQVVDADPAEDGIQITAGSCPSPDFLLDNDVNNATGVISFTTFSLNPSPPCSGSGTVASIEFSGKAKGQSSIAFDSYILSDLDGFVIPSGEGSSSITVIDSGQITGHASLQGRTNPVGTNVSVWQNSVMITETVLTASGDFGFLLEAGEYEIVVEMNRYLDAVKYPVSIAAGGTNNLTSVTLLGGDANEDDTINILDLSLMGFNFMKTCSSGSWDARADINNDCIVNIQDLTIAGGNFLKTSPVPWP